MLISDYMTRQVMSFKPDDEILRALHLMHKHHLSNAPVVDDQGALIGIMSDRDCIRGVLQGAYHSEFAGLVGDFMSTKVETVGPDESLIDVARKLIDLPYRLYPVVIGDEMLGVISRGDIIAALSEKWQWSS